MKLIIIAILFLQTLALKEDAGAESNQKDIPHRSEATAESQQYWYLSTPYYYSYYPSYYTWYYPSYYYLWRTSEDNNEAERKDEKQQKFDPIKAKEELIKLKKEIWGKEDFSTEQIRSEKKAYDSRWLIAQLKISRALELEDMIKNPPKEEKEEKKDKEQKKSLRTESEAHQEVSNAPQSKNKNKLKAADVTNNRKTPEDNVTKDGKTPEANGTKDGKTPEANGTKDGKTPEANGTKDGKTLKANGTKDGKTLKANGTKNGKTPKANGTKKGNNGKKGREEEEEEVEVEAEEVQSTEQ